MSSIMRRLDVKVPGPVPFPADLPGVNSHIRILKWLSLTLSAVTRSRLRLLFSACWLLPRYPHGVQVNIDSLAMRGSMHLPSPMDFMGSPYRPSLRVPARHGPTIPGSSQDAALGA